jgi:predicted transcriptional regulator
MESATGAEKYFLNRLLSPSYAEAHADAARRIAMFDRLIDLLNGRREELGWSKAELGRKSGLPAPVIRRIFSQKHKNPTLTTLIAICDALGTEIAIRSVSEKTALSAAIRR